MSAPDPRTPPTPLEAACLQIRPGGYDTWFDLEADMSKAIAAYLQARAKTAHDLQVYSAPALLRYLASELERGDKP